jgi:hypothetical protein|tara:strand:+ start:377 stop:1918 length:1542 start_codon:yes stop_codon:yes gene_type:complete
MFKLIDPQKKSIRSFKSYKTFNVTNNTSASYGNFVVRAISGSHHNYNTGSDTVTHIVSGSISSSYYALPTYLLVRNKYYLNPNGADPTVYRRSKDALYDHKNINKELQEKANVFSIPRGLFGEKIKPGSIKLSDTSNSITFDIRDDGEGNLYDHAYSSSFAAWKTGSFKVTESLSVGGSGSQVGNAFYEQGMLVFTDTGSYKDVGFGTSYTLEFKATQTHYEHEYVVVANQYEYNATTNISATLDRSGSISITAGAQDIITDIEGAPLLDEFGRVQWTGNSPYNMLPPGSGPRGDLVTNGDFTQVIAGNGTATLGGWVTNGTATVNTGSTGGLYLTASAGAYPSSQARVIQEVSTKIGKKYLLTGRFQPTDTFANGAQGNVVIEENGYFAGTHIAMTGGIPATQKFNLAFTATKETHHIILTMEKNTVNDAAIWDNISLKEWHGFNSGIGDYKSSYEATDTYNNFVTHSEFRPYVTQIGLYDAKNQLLGHAKLGRPIKLDDKYDTSFVIRFDV